MTVLLLLGLAGASALVALATFHGGRRTRLLLGIGGPIAIFVALKIGAAIDKPCSDTEGSDCYETLGYIFLGVALFITLEVGVLAGIVAAAIKSRSTKEIPS